MTKCFKTILTHPRPPRRQMGKSKYLAILQLIFIYFLIVCLIILLEYIDIFSILQKLFINQVYCSSNTPSVSGSSSSSTTNVVCAALAGATFTSVFAALPKTMPIVPKTATSVVLASATGAVGDGLYKMSSALIETVAQGAISTGTELVKASPHADPNPERVPSPTINDQFDSYHSVLEDHEIISPLEQILYGLLEMNSALFVLTLLLIVFIFSNYI